MTPGADMAGEQLSPSGQSWLSRQMVQSTSAPHAKQHERSADGVARQRLKPSEAWRATQN
jgi:hypothetical protein